MIRRVRSALLGMRWAWTRSVKPGSLCPRYSLTVRIDSPPSRRALAKKCRSAWQPFSRDGASPAAMSAGFQMWALK
jgi:hypothetical protein